LLFVLSRLSFAQFLIFFPAVISIAFAFSAALGNGVIGYPAGEWFYKFLDPICHQFPTLSFWVSGHPLGLCARCTGGYIGVAAGVLLVGPLIEKFGALKIYSVTVTIFLVCILEALIHPSDDNVWRAVSGFFGGVGAALTFACLIHALAKAVSSFRMKSNDKIVK